MKASFRVENVHSAEPALKLGCVFSQRGGHIGSASDATWRIQDIAGQVPATAARVAVVDGRFTLEALGAAQIRLNGAGAGIALGRPVVLSDKDEIALGELRITVRLSEALTGPEGRGLNGLVETRDEGPEALVIDGEFAEACAIDPAAARVVDDPLSALDRAAPNPSLRPGLADPLRAFEALETAEARPSLANPHATLQSDSRSEVNSAVTLPKTSRDRFGFETADTGDDFDSELVDHVALRPLARALGLPVRDVDSLESGLMLSEIGATLRAAVEGLNRIYAARAGQASRFPLATMHMHVIEDNPLRFSKSGQEAMEALFSHRGTVHLSAPAALTESLDHLAQHHDASEAAVDRALEAVFTALKPAALERRFAAYARDAGPAPGPARDAWCWQMYKAYFAELASQRQKGLQMLFWEVFAYEYQALMRAHAFGEGRSTTEEFEA